MISFQRLLGKEVEFCGLLESSASEACRAVEALRNILSQAGVPQTLWAFAEVRNKSKEVTEALTEKLITTFVTPIEREDIEALAEALYKIPKTVDKFAQRYAVVATEVADIDFHPQVQLMSRAVQLVLQMVQTIRGGRNLGHIRVLQRDLVAVESEADDLLLELTRLFYQAGFPVLKAIILKDLYGLNERVVNRCRDAGSVISHVLVKNS